MPQSPGNWSVAIEVFIMLTLECLLFSTSNVDSIPTSVLHSSVLFLALYCLYFKTSFFLLNTSGKVKFAHQVNGWEISGLQQVYTLNIS